MTASSTRARVLLLALALTIVPVWSGPAAAHTRLVGTAPAAGAAAPAGTDRVVLSFNQAVSGELAVVEVTGPDGDAASTGPATASGSDVVQQVRAPLEAGAWTVAYRVISGDGHPISGTFAFSVAADPAAATTAPATAGPAAAAPTDGAGETPDPAPRAASDADPAPEGTSMAMPAAVGTAALAAAGGVLLLRRRRGPGHRGT